MSQSTRHSITIPPELDGRRLDQVLAELFPDFSRSRHKQWIQEGCVSLDGARPLPRTKVSAGQQVDLTTTVEPAPVTRAEPVALDIVFEDEAFMVINKPAGLVVHPGAGHAGGTLENGLLHHAPELGALPRSGLLHRLDKDTSGLLLVVKTLPAHTRMVRDLQERKITREYRAICDGRLTAGGTVDVAIGRHPTQRTRMAVNPRGREAVTHYRVLARFAAHGFLAVRLETGRTHQIRVHMAHIHHPLVGDPVYGGRLKIPAQAGPLLADQLRGFRRQALHASRLSFSHPLSGETMEFRACLPEDMNQLLHALAGEQTAGNRFEAMEWPEKAPLSG